MNELFEEKVGDFVNLKLFDRSPCCLPYFFLIPLFRKLGKGPITPLMRIPHHFMYYTYSLLIPGPVQLRNVWLIRNKFFIMHGVGAILIFRE